MKALLGTDRDTGEKVYVPKKSFDTHWHLIGGTGKGKTTAIHTLLHPLLLDPVSDDCWFVIDRMGNLSFDLLLWATSDFCTEDVRQRIVYIEPAREDVILGFNPLSYETPQHGYYKVGRATDCILRAWQSQDIGQMPRLARWVFNSFWAAAQLGLTVADCGHILNPGSAYHTPILDALPPLLRAEWADILRSHGRAVEILDSSRNRLKPYFEAPILRRMFGTTRNGLDAHRFMREGKIVVLNLASYNRLSPQLADAIGGLVLNEVLATARALPPWERHPTFLLLDEFQRFVGPDIEEALPEVRQLQLKLILAHQSLAQLKRGDLDLTTMIFQAQSRLIFGLSGEDATLLGEELASLHFNPMRIKDEIRVRRQKVIGHRVVELSSYSQSDSDSKNWNETYGKNTGNTTQFKAGSIIETGEARSRVENEGGGTGGGKTSSVTRGTHQTLVPDYEEYDELASRTYATFEEDKQVWARDVRKLKTGEAYLRLVDDERVRAVKVKRSAVGYLGLGAAELKREFPDVLDDVDRFKETNFRSGLFLTPADIDRETEERLTRILHPPITITSGQAKEILGAAQSPDAAEPEGGGYRFPD
jgi:hypothetical protein